MKKRIVGFAIALTIVAGGTGYAAGNLKEELKQTYQQDIMQFMNDFQLKYKEQKVDHDTRIKQETTEYLNTKLAEYEERKMKELNEWDKQQADLIIQEVKDYIDKEVSKY